MLTLIAHELCWIQGAADDPSDQCAHGKVELVVDGVQLVRPGQGPWTVTMAALYLLRTLTGDHTPEQSVAQYNFLFPHCGFCPWLGGQRYPVMCMGCDDGVEVWVRHDGSTVQLRLDADWHVVPLPEWRAAVLGFSTQVEEFYARCSPKREIRDALDRDGWSAFWEEWQERMSSARIEGR